jgi:transcriptional regulator with XRE-family HTH domain
MARNKKLQSKLGLRLREIRREKKVTLVELANQTGVAQATLSRMECGLMTGTVNSHQKIAEVLGVSLARLYDGIDNRKEKIGYLKTSEYRKVTGKTDRVKIELLTQEVTKKKITPILITMNPSGKTQEEQLERGVEKFYLVLEGNVKAVIGNTDYALEPYETLYFEAAMPHCLVNTGSKQAKIFCAVSPAKI